MKVFQFSIDNYDDCTDYQWVHSNPNKTADDFRNDIKYALKSTGIKYLEECINNKTVYYGRHNNAWIDRTIESIESMGYTKLDIESTVSILDPTFSLTMKYDMVPFDENSCHIKQLIEMVGIDLIKKAYEHNQIIENAE